MPRYIEENEIYNLFNARGVAQLHVGDIDVLPRVEIKEAVRGRWEEADDGDGAVCSVCREDFCNIYLEIDRFNYCPNCGAEMSK